METNTWTLAYGYENQYLINHEGDVKTISRGGLNSIGRNYSIRERDMAQFIDRAKYWTVKLTKDRKSGTRYIHRLLAQTFLANPFNKPFVNHKNGEKLDNRLENLEWVTRSENQKHAIKMNLCKPPHKNRKPVRDRCTGKVYPSMVAVSVDKNIPYDEVKHMLNRKSGTCLEFAA